MIFSCASLNSRTSKRKNAGSGNWREINKMTDWILLAANASEYVQGIITGAIALTAIWGFAKVVKEIKKENDTEHDRRQKWDTMADVVEKNKEDWNKGLKDIYAERGAIVERYDGRLDEQDGKIQQLYSMMCMSLKAQDAILEALANDNIGNGDIKAMKKKLSDFIADQIGA